MQHYSQFFGILPIMDDYELNGRSYRLKMLNVELVHGFLPGFFKNLID